MPNWKTAESYQRLLAAMVASQDLKLNFKQIAKYYGEGTTYNSIEGRFRIIKEHAKILKAEVDSDEPDNPAPTTSCKKNASTNGTPTAKKEKVLGGRVAKNSTPSKATKASLTSRDSDEASRMLGMDGVAEVSNGNVIMGVKEEVASSGESSYHSGEDTVNAVVPLSMDLSWNDGFLDQQLI